MRILFVCLGNICRSPTAEIIFQSIAEKRGLDHLIEVDSAGTSDYHVYSPADDRAQRSAKRRGYDLSSCRGRQVNYQDLIDFDMLIAMDRSNADDLSRIADPQQEKKIRLFLEFAPSASFMDVPDPYYGGNSGFDRVIDLIEEASYGLLDHIEALLDDKSTA